MTFKGVVQGLILLVMFPLIFAVFHLHEKIGNMPYIVIMFALFTMCIVMMHYGVVSDNKVKKLEKEIKELRDATKTKQLIKEEEES